MWIRAARIFPRTAKYLLSLTLNLRDCRTGFPFGELRNRQDWIRRTFGDEGRGILVTLKKDLENLKASEDGVNPKNSIVWAPASCAVFRIAFSYLSKLLVFLILRNGAWIPRPSCPNMISIYSRLPVSDVSQIRSMPAKPEFVYCAEIISGDCIFLSCMLPFSYRCRRCSCRCFDSGREASFFSALQDRSMIR